MNKIKPSAILLPSLQRTHSDLFNYLSFFTPDLQPTILIPRVFLDLNSVNILTAANIKYSALESTENINSKLDEYEKKLEELSFNNTEVEPFTEAIKISAKQKIAQDIELIDALEEAKEKYNIIGFITSNECFPRERIMRDWSLSQNIPTIHINHGAVLARPSNIYNDSQCKTFTLTSPNELAAIDTVNSKLANPSELIVCGMASWDKYALLQTEKNKQKFKEDLGLDEEQKIVTFFPTLAITGRVTKDDANLHLDGIKYFIQAVAQLAPKFPDTVFIIKDRPSNDTFIEDLIKIELKKHNIDSKQLLYKFDYAEPYVAFSDITIASLSTISSESILCQVPHLNVMHHPSFQVGFDPNTGVPPVFYDELAEQLEPLLANKEAYEQLKNEQLASNSLTGPARDFCSSIRVAIEIANTFNYPNIATKLNTSLKEWQNYRAANPNLTLIELIENPENPIHYHWQNVQLLLNYDKRFGEEDAYQKWLASKVTPIVEGQLMGERLQNWKTEPSFHLIYPVADNQLASLADSLDALDKQMYKKYGISILCTQACPDAELLNLPHLQWIETPSPFDEINQVINKVESDWVMILLPGDLLTSDALFNFAEYANLNSDWLALYADEDNYYFDQKGNKTRCEPNFKPNFNYDLLLSTNYIGRCVALRRDAIQALDGLTSLPYLQNEDLLLRIGAKMTLPAIGHLPFISNSKFSKLNEELNQKELEQLAANLRLKHLEERGLNQVDLVAGLKPNSWQVKYPLPNPAPKVAILLPLIIEEVDQLNAITDLIQKTTYPNWQLYVGIPESNNKLINSEVLQENISICLISLTNEEITSRAASLSRLANAATDADFYCFYEADLRLVQDNWLENLVTQGLRAEIGLVAPRLIRTNGRIFGVGQVLGMNGSVGDLYADFYLEQDVTNQTRAWCDQNFSALNSNCALISKENFAKFGLNAELAQAFYLTDLGLRMQQEGLRLHWTPSSTLVSLGFAQKEKETYKEGELDSFYRLWFDYLAYDPAHNSNLELSATGSQPDSTFKYNWHPIYRQQPRLLFLPLHISNNEINLVNSLGYYLDKLEQEEIIRLGNCNTRLSAKANHLPHLVELARTDADIILCTGDEPEGYQGTLAQLKQLTGMKLAVYNQKPIEESSWYEYADSVDFFLTPVESLTNTESLTHQPEKADKSLHLPFVDSLPKDKISNKTNELAELLLEALKKN